MSLESTLQLFIQKKVEPCTLKFFNITLAVVTAGYVVSRIVSVSAICWFHFVCGVMGRKKYAEMRKKYLEVCLL